MTRDQTYITSDPRLTSSQGGDLGARRIALLEAIDAEGSIAAAAKVLGMSYRSAWDAVAQMNNLWEAPLVDKTSGGSRGGGTRLTPQGRDLIAGFRLMQTEYQRFTEGLNRRLGDFERFQQGLRRLSMRTSARNQFQGRVAAVCAGPVNSEVTLAIGEGEQLTAIVTSESVASLGLAPGSEAYALVKATFVILAPAGVPLATSARNRLCGTVQELRHGPVECEVVIALAGGKTLAAVITEQSAGRPEFQEGQPVCALIKASHVILGVN